MKEIEEHSIGCGDKHTLPLYFLDQAFPYFADSILED